MFLGEHIAAVFVSVTCTAKLYHMFYTSRNEEALLRVGTEVEVFLVVQGTCNVFAVNGILAEHILTIVTVHELAIAEVCIDLQPALRVRNRPETVSADVNLGYGLGVIAFGEGARRQ